MKKRKNIVEQASHATGLSVLEIIRMCFEEDGTKSAKALDEALEAYKKDKKLSQEVKAYAKTLLFG
jgi:pyruvate/2-oxoacid:ferredoxin oxidoreductase beta subunit